MPISRRKATQNWWVLHIFRTLGIPTRIPERSLGGGGNSAEAFLANHVCNVGKRILGFLDSGLDHFHFIQILDESLGTRVVDDHSLPSQSNGNLAPLAALAAGQSHVNEAALAIHRAPVAYRFLRSRGVIRQFFNHVESAELGPAALFPPIKRNESRGERTGFTRIGQD